MSGVFLPPLNLPRLSETGSVVGGANSFGSTGGSISARYAHMRAQGAATQGALSARTPRAPPSQLSPLKQQPLSPPHNIQSALAAAKSPQQRVQEEANMSLETASSEELRELNASQPSPEEEEEAEESALLLILPGYTGVDGLIEAVRSNPSFEIVNEKGKEKIRKLAFTEEQAQEFVKAVVPREAKEAEPAAESDEPEERANGNDDEEKEANGDGSDTEEATEANGDDENDISNNFVPMASPTLLTTTTIESLLGGVSYAVHVTGRGAIRALTSWIDDQDQRAYVHVSSSTGAAEREIELLFATFRAPTQTTLALIKPDAIASGYFHAIMSRIKEEGFEVERQEESIRFTEEQAKVFYAEHAQKAFYPLLVKFMSSGPLCALTLKKENGIAAWRKLIGGLTEPSSLRGLYATDGTRNAVHGSDSPQAAEREIDLVFGQFCPVNQVSFALVKPDGMAHKQAILQRLTSEGFDLTRIQHIDRLTTEQVRLFFTNQKQWLQPAPIQEKSVPASLAASPNGPGSPIGSPVKRSSAGGVGSNDALPPPPPPPTVDRPNFELLLEHLQKGPCLAIELKKAQCVRTLRKVVGGKEEENLVDPSLAAAADHNSLRAQFGSSVLANAIYISPTILEGQRDAQLMFQDHKFFPSVSETFLLIKPDIGQSTIPGQTEQILQRIQQDGFRIVRQKKLRLTESQLYQLFPQGAPATSPSLSEDDLSSGDWTTFMTSGTCHAFQLKRADAVDELQRLVGVVDEALSNLASSNPIESLKQSSPQSLKALYGVNSMLDGFHAASSATEASRMIDLVFHSWFPELQSTYGMIKPDAYGVKGNIDAILTRIRNEGFEIVRKSKVHLSKEQALKFYEEHNGRIFQPGLVEFMTSGPSLAMELRKVDAIRAWRTLLGPTDSNAARSKAPNSLRALYGTDGRRNACHGSDSAESAAREIELVFEQFVPMIETTCCLLKPETLVSNVAKSMLKRIIQEGFEVTRQEKMTLTIQQAMRFYAEHAGALYFPDLLNYMTSGPVIALALRKENAVKAFRELMGVTDSTVARRIQPQSLRALYGTDKKFNAVHGSESREAAAREVDLAFNSFSVGIQDTFCWIKPDGEKHEKEILQRLIDEGFTVIKSVRRTLSPAQAKKFYDEHSQASFFDALVKYMTSGEVVGLILRKENAVRALRELSGPTSSILAKQTDPDSLRAIWGTDGLKNAIHSSKTPESASREINLVFTEFFVGLQSTLALLKPDAIARQAEGPILDMIKQAGFEILRKKALSLTADQAKQFYEQHSSQPFFDGLISFMTSGPCIAYELRKDNGIQAWRDLLGPTNSEKAREIAPDSIRAKFGTDGRMNAGHGSDSQAAAKRELALIFDTFSSQLLTTICLIKPEAVKKGSDDAIIKRITEAGFEVIARKRLQLTPAMVKTLYMSDVSKPFFKAASEHLSSGPVICVALRKNAAITELHNLVGPENPRVAKKTHPNSLRALFGTDVNRNAVHCPSSLATNAREVSLIFGDYHFEQLDEGFGRY